jgi:uncharacterized protein
MRVPTDEEIQALHARHAPTAGALDLVWAHCLIVGAIAEQLCARLPVGGGAVEVGAVDVGAVDVGAVDVGAVDVGAVDVGAVDVELVRAGSLLHDIGVYRLYDGAGALDYASYLRHGVLGYELLGEEGFPETLRRFASHHTGVGISRADVVAQRLPLPVADYLAETGEERLVMYADKFHSKTTPPVFLTASAAAARLARFGPEKVRAFQALRDTFGEPDLGPLSRAYGHAVVGRD